MMNKPAFLLIFFTALFIVTNCRSQSARPVNYHLSLNRIIDSLSINQNALSVLIDKSDLRLYVKHQSTILKEYPVVFGKSTTEDKLMEGDRCTPEGNFHIISKYPHRSWSKFIWIDYPNEGSWQKHKDAKKTGIIPKDANIGGEIGIHGVPEGMDHLIDQETHWTLGCISLKNKDVNEIYLYIDKNTLITIRK